MISTHKSEWATTNKNTGSVAYFQQCNLTFGFVFLIRIHLYWSSRRNYLISLCRVNQLNPAAGSSGMHFQAGDDHMEASITLPMPNHWPLNPTVSMRWIFLMAATGALCTVSSTTTVKISSTQICPNQVCFSTSIKTPC